MPPKKASRPRPVAVAMPAEAPLEAALSLPRPQGAWKVLAFILSALQPVLGLVLALLYWKASEAPVRRFSRVCLGLAIIAWIVSGGLGALQSGLQGGEWFIQPY